MTSWVRVVLEFDGNLVLNNEVLCEQSPVAFDWVKGSGFLVDFDGRKKVINLGKPTPNVLEISPTLYLVRLTREKAPESELKVVYSNTFQSFLNRYTVEIANGASTSYFTVKFGRDNRFAFDLGVLVVEPSVSMKNNKLVLEAKNTALTYCLQSNKVEKHTKKLFANGPVHFMFIQHVMNQEWGEAQALLAFNIGEAALSKYFGGIREVLLNNYLDEENSLSVIKDDGKVQTFRFQLDGGHISNVQ